MSFFFRHLLVFSKMRGIFASMLFIALALPATAVIIGIDHFDYVDGSINKRAGGIGWDYNGGAVSEWSGSGTVSDGVLTNPSSSGAFRNFSDPIGTGTVSSMTIYFAVHYTETSPQGWSGLSAFGGGSERVFFGRPSGRSNFGMQVYSGNGITASTIPIVSDTEFLLIGAIDFTNGLAKLWVNPDQNSYDNGLDNDADLTAYYSGSSVDSIRIAAEGSGTSWDNVVVATSLAEALAAVPEPGVSALAVLALCLAMRRR